MKNTDLTPLQKARADLEAKKAAIQALESEIEAIRGAIRYMEGIYSERPAIMPDNSDLVGIDRGVRPATKEAVASAFCEEYVREHGAATGGDLYNAFIEAGHSLAGKDRNAQMATLAGYLKRVGKLMYYKESGRWFFVGELRPIRIRPVKFL